MWRCSTAVGRVSHVEQVQYSAVYFRMAGAALPSLRIRPGELPQCVLMPGDPERAAKIAGYLDEFQVLARNREFHSYRGSYRGVEIGVVSTGIGSPGAALCSEEAIQAGARVLLRVGTAGSLQDAVQDGHLVVVTGAARCEGTTGWLVPGQLPAVADHDVVGSLWEASRSLKERCHRGLVATLDLFYEGVLDLGLDVWSRAGVLAVEMECAAIFCVALLRRVQAGAIVAVDGDARGAAVGTYDPHRDVVRSAIDAEIRVALEAAVRLGGQRAELAEPNAVAGLGSGGAGGVEQG